LQRELSRGRISKAELAIGRRVELWLEKVNSIGRHSLDGIRVASAGIRSGNAAALVMGNRIEFQNWLTQKLDPPTIELLVRILGMRMSFGDVAALQGRAGDEAAAHVGRKFRGALAALAEGSPPP
jgi:hypothetical protein